MKKTIGRPPASYDPVVGARIREVRKENKLSQAEFAERIGVQQKTVSNWETSKTNPSKKDLEEIATIFSVDAAWLSNFVGNIVGKSKKILESVSANDIAEHDYLSRLLYRMGYDLALLQMTNTNTVPYLLRTLEHAAEQINLFADEKKREYIEGALKFALDNMELLDEGRRK